MTPAEFTVVREYLGLPWAWLARHLEVAERTVARWESGQSRVPHGVRVQIERLESETADVIEAAIAAYDDMRDPTEHPLITYRTDADYRAHHPELEWPASWHRAVCARVAEAVPGLTIVYWHPEIEH